MKLTEIDKDLIDAANNGDLDLVKTLISNGANFAVDNNSAVKWATNNGHLEVAKYLVSLGADMADVDSNIHNTRGWCVIGAAVNGHLETLKYTVSLISADLISANLTCDNTVQIVLRLGHLKVARYLISIGADVSGMHIEYHRPDSGPDDSSEDVRYLVSKGANASYAARSASINGDQKLVEYLVSQGANATIRDNEALKNAARNGHLEVVKYLISVGADVTAGDSWAVISASWNGHSDVVEYLAQIGMDIVSQCNGSSALCSQNNYPWSSNLLSSVSKNIVSQYRSALRKAVKSGHAKVVRCLISAGVDFTGCKIHKMLGLDRVPNSKKEILDALSIYIISKE